MAQTISPCPSLPASTTAINTPGLVSPATIQAAMRATLAIETPLPANAAPENANTHLLGSGVIISANGLFLTNAHVVGPYTAFTVRFSDGKTAQASLVGLDRLVDIALLRLDNTSVDEAALPFLPLKFNQTSSIGEPVVALGYPLTFGLSATRGIISGLGRAYDEVWPVDFLQHDAALNPGNSGGPLIDSQGCLLGLNTATPVETLFDIGVGLAIPADLIAELVPQLLTNGRFPRGSLGILVSNADTSIVAALGAGRTPGLLVDDFDIRSTAALAGLAQGDIITHIDGRPTRQVRALTRSLLRRRQGEAVQLTINRQGQVMSIRVTLGDSALNQSPKTTDIVRQLPTPTTSNQDLGFTIAARNSRPTVQEIANDGLAQRAGLEIGDTILALNGMDIVDSQVFEVVKSQLIHDRSTQPIVLRIARTGMPTRHIVLHLAPSAPPKGFNNRQSVDTQSLPYGPL